MGEYCRPAAKTGAFGALPATAPNLIHSKDPAERTAKNHLESVMKAPFSSRVFEEPDQLKTQQPNRLNTQPSHAESQRDTSGSVLPVSQGTAQGLIRGWNAESIKLRGLLLTAALEVIFWSASHATSPQTPALWDSNGLDCRCHRSLSFTQFCSSFIA